jgi:serine/threonine-protein kinase HipA
VVKTLDVYLGGVLCGVLEQTDSGNLSFRYDDDYRMMPEATPLSLSMPLAASHHPKRSVLPFLEGLLPDSAPALSAMAQRFGVSPKNPFALLGHIGRDVAGAIVFMEPGLGPPPGEPLRSEYRLIADDEVAGMLRAAITRYEAGVDGQGSPGQFSLAGAQPKIALLKSAEGWAVPENDTPTSHILKPVAGTMRQIDVVEHLTISAARRLGNSVAHSSLASIDGVDVFVSERYDRIVQDSLVTRVHQEDLCQALAVSPTKKYQRQDGGPGVRDIAKLLGSLPLEDDRIEAARSFYRALVFNVIAGCTDAHAKNYSLLLTGNSVTLAPLYDLVSYAAYWDGRSPIYSSMSIEGEFSLAKISQSQLIYTGRLFGLDDEAEDIVIGSMAGMAEAFSHSRDELLELHPEARSMADTLVGNVERLPLVS